MATKRATKRVPIKKPREPVAARVCPNCAYISEEPVARCPRCNAAMAIEHDDNAVDKAGADSFPASDPPQH